MRIEKLSSVVPLVILLIALAVHANAVDIAGKIRGVVTDQSGAGVVGATVVARNAETAVETKVTTAEDGSYSFESLLPAAYTVTCELPGFKKFLTADVRVTAQQTTTLLISLTVGAVTESVEVTAAATQVDTISHRFFMTPVARVGTRC